MEYVMQESPKLSREIVDRVNQACYDNRAAYWDRFPFPESLKSLIPKYYNKQLRKRVLDIGSGTGVLAKWLVDQGFDVLCLDPSSEMVQRCRSKGLQTVQGSFQDYQPNGPFAMVFAILSLIHVPKAEFDAQLFKIANALPKGGMLFLAMLEGRGEGFFEGPDYPRFFSYYRLDELLILTQPYFIQRDYSYVNAGGIGYMLFVLEKKE